MTEVYLHGQYHQLFLQFTSSTPPAMKLQNFLGEYVSVSVSEYKYNLVYTVHM